MVLITVVMVILVMSIFAVSFLSQNLNQNMSSQSQVDQIKAQELATGTMAKAYSDLYAGVAAGAVSSPAAETLDGKVFTPVVSPSGATGVQANVSY